MIQEGEADQGRDSGGRRDYSWGDQVDVSVGASKTEAPAGSR